METMAIPSPLAELHQQAGATVGEFLGCSLPARFAGFDEEYKSARTGAALVDANYLACLHFAGPDRVRYLNAITTNDVAGLKEGQGNIGLLLNPQGHILAELITLALPDRLLVLSHAAVRGRTAQTLDKFIIMDDVAMTDATEATGALAVEGPAADALLHEACGVRLNAMAEFAHREAVVGTTSCRVVRSDQFGAVGALILAERAQLAALWKILLEAVRRHAGGPVGCEALNTLRLEAGIPWFGLDFDDKVIPHEAGLETSHINFTKGCYTGQEIVERVRSRGHVNRRRVGLKLSAWPAASPPRLFFQGKDIGWVTSVAPSPALGAFIGMGYLRTEHSAPGTRLETEGAPVEVVQLPVLPAK